MSTIRPDFHTTLATRVIEDIYYQRSNYYYYLGKIEPWSGGEDEPPLVAPLTTSEQDTIIRDNILYMRRITGNDVSLAVTSYQWESGVVFTQWDHTQIMVGENFYCITDEFIVYKCLDNNLGAPSTIKPTGTALTPFRTSDGYLWKYMYSVPAFKRDKFNSRGRMPIQRSLSDTFYNKGSVEDIVVLDGGSGYTDVQLTNITVVGTTTGAGATAKVATVNASGGITGITILTAGTGYTAGAIVTVDSVNGTGASIKIVASSGVVTGFNIITAGSNYQVNDDVDISVGGAVITPVISHTTGEIVSTRTVNPGAGYTAAPTLTVTQSPTTGTGKYGNATAILSSIVYQGSIVEVLISDPGQNYPVDSETTIVVSGDGEGASFSPVVSNGEVVDVIVENPGIGYSTITLTVVGNGEGASVDGIVGVSDFVSDQSIVEQTAVRGALYNAVITVPGNNYSNETTVTITGDGSGATASLVLQNGSIQRVVMTSYGQDYTYATFTINDPNRLTPNSFTDAEIYAILPPPSGHGFDAPREMYADTIAVFSLLQGDTELNMLQQDYRQYGILADPTNILTNRRLTLPSTITSFTITLSSTDGIAADDVLINNNKRYRVVEVEGSDVEVQQLNSIYALPSGFFFKEGIPAILYTITRILTTPSANKYSGNLMYTTNSTPFTPTDQQSVAIRTYIKL